MSVRPIRTGADHAAAITRIKSLWDAQPGSPDHDELVVLSVLVSAFEDRRRPMLPPDPVDAIKFHMEQNGFMQKDFAAVVDGVSRASEVLNRRRPLTIEMIRAIHAAWTIPLNSLIGKHHQAA